MTIDLSNLFTVLVSGGSTGLALWAHGREFNKEKRRTLKEYAAAEVAANGIRRDIDHLKRDFQQLSANVAHLDQENEDRFRANETQISQLSGAVSLIKGLLQVKSA